MSDTALGAMPLPTELPFRARGFVARLMPDNSQTMTLPTLLGKFLHETQMLFGARDYSWTPLGVVFSAVGPMMVMPDPERRQALIMLSIPASHDLDRAAYELAHETVHLLSPNVAGPGETIVLEEGCADAFADLKAIEIGYTDPRMTLPADHPYEAAKQLTLRLLNMDGNAVRKLRAVEPQFAKITPDHFAQVLPDVPADLAHALCQKFEYDEESKVLRAQATIDDGSGKLSEWFSARDAEEANAQKPV